MNELYQLPYVDIYFMSKSYYLHYNHELCALSFSTCRKYCHFLPTCNVSVPDYRVNEKSYIEIDERNTVFAKWNVHKELVHTQNSATGVTIYNRTEKNCWVPCPQYRVIINFGFVLIINLINLLFQTRMMWNFPA